jgi:hypothetical protein
MAAPLAFQAEVHANPQDFPVETATGVFLFQTDNIAQFIGYLFHVSFLS